MRRPKVSPMAPMKTRTNAPGAEKMSPEMNPSERTLAGITTEKIA